MRAFERFLTYAKIGTASCRAGETVPSTMCQFDLAHQLVFELRELGVTDAGVNNHCVVYAHIPAAPGHESAPASGFIAHLDTFPDCCGEGVLPQIVPNYSGGDLPLGTSGRVLRTAEFPHLAALAGQTLITTDGVTHLGAHDKAGIAEIMTAVTAVLEQSLPHGPLSLCFLPDEEVSTGFSSFDLQAFGAQYAYSVDGWQAGEIVWENFNADSALVTVAGFDTHSGRAKGIMRNAQLIAMELCAMLPPEQIPAETDGREGFYHLLHFEGTVESAQLVFNLRDFDADGFAERRQRLKNICAALNQKYGADTVTLEFKEQYRSMGACIRQHYHMVENAEKAVRAAGLEPRLTSLRGGTAGAHLAKLGLPCPDLGVGGYAYHSVNEHITAEAMDKVSEILVNLIGEYAEE